MFLVSKGILNQPLLYLSEYFEKNKSHYYDNLTAVREKNEMIHWLKYFLTGIEKTSKEAVETLSEILKLKLSLETRIHTSWGRRTRQALVLLNQLFIHPVVTIKETQSICGLSKKASGDLIERFEREKIIRELTGQSRNRVFIFSSYLDLF